MQLFYSFVAGLLAALLLASMALAEPALVEVEGAAFGIAVHPKMSVSFPPIAGDAGLAAAAKLPHDVADMQVVEITWPRSKKSCSLVVGDSGVNHIKRQEGAGVRSNLAIVLDGNARALNVPDTIATGLLSRVCVWPTSVNDSGELVFVCSFYSETSYDSSLHAFSLGPDGTIYPVDLAGAKSLFAWFEMQDIDNDGDYELVTSRSLDGTPGGLFYHSIREFDAASQRYAAAPEGYSAYFTKELAWLDWVVNTRALIQSSPQDYMRSGNDWGQVFVADYEGTTFGFDSIVEVDEGFLGMQDVMQYNQERRNAFQLVKSYRDQLKAWLAGGAKPDAWKL